MSIRPATITSSKDAMPSKFADPIVEMKNNIRDRLRYFIEEYSGSHDTILDTLSKNVPHFQNLNSDFVTLALLYYFKRPVLESRYGLDPSIEGIASGSHNQLFNHYNVPLEDSNSQAAFVRYYTLIIDTISFQRSFSNTDRSTVIVEQENLEDRTEEVTGEAS